MISGALGIINDTVRLNLKLGSGLGRGWLLRLHFGIRYACDSFEVDLASLKSLAQH